MTFEKAIYSACRELGYDGHIKEIKYKRTLNLTQKKLHLILKNRLLQ